MKLNMDKKDLLALVARAQNIVEKRNTMPVLVNVLLEAQGTSLKVFATDLEVSLTDEAPAQILTAGKVAINAKSFFDIIKELPDGEVQLEKKENNWLKITQRTAVFNIVGISPDEYPVFPGFTTDEFMYIEADVFKEMIEKTIYSVSNDETRYHLNGVFFEKQVSSNNETIYRMVATDGHRLSLVDRAAKKPGPAGSKSQGVIIPRKGLNEIRKLLENTEGLN
jgi:DNA polymerase-3 subunit beta